VVIPRATVLTRQGLTTCDRVALRSGPSGLAEPRTSLDTGVAVAITATVTGNSWSITCDGQVVSGRTWFKIGSVAGSSVASSYGAAYLYAPTGQFATESVDAIACLVAPLHEGPSSLTRRVVRMPPGTVATVTATVTGEPWHVRCGGRWLNGTTWYRVGALNGQPLAELSGTPSAYVASGLFQPGLVAPAVTPAAELLATLPTAGIAQGIDVSHHNGRIDWQKVRNAGGKRFAFIKASEATAFVDWTYERNRAAAKAAGVLVGAYHFARPGPGRGDAIAEADHFMATAQFSSGELVPILDLEHTGGLSKRALGSWVISFLNRVHDRSGVRPAIYVSPEFWKKHVGNTTSIAALGYDLLWVAHWTHDDAPRVPAANWAGNGWTVWQFSDKGKVPGIKGRVDFDRVAAQDLARLIIP
jgi:GH25 family lysozyme M1 (1,4-beta-N-acetylmuramidase)